MSLEPIVRAAEEEEEEELVDPMDTLKEECAETHKCADLSKLIQVCTDRVTSSPGTAETCTEELHDFIHCVDHCVSKSLFQRLK